MVNIQTINQKDPKLILGSGSLIRKTILQKSGLKFSAQPPDVDEGALKLTADVSNAEEMSAYLAREKARSIPARESDLVIGSDQILEFKGQLYDKVSTQKKAKERLDTLSGQTHYLVSTTVLMKEKHVVWEHHARSQMTMRALSSCFIDSYLRDAGEGILASVGCYEVEGLGITLFESMKGDYFSILGLPLLPLLKALRDLDAIPA